MADRIELRTVTRDGTPGDLIAAANLLEDGVSYAGQVAEDTFKSLARHSRRTEAAIFALITANGWSNGWLLAVNA